MKVLVTGGAGFIGSTFIKWLHNSEKSAHITNLDALTYAGNLEKVKEVEGSDRYKFVHGNICDSGLTDKLVAGQDILINFAAETHVDKSIVNPIEFIKTNVEGTRNLLESVRKHAPKIKFVQISTDEVYGSLGETGKFTEESSISPNNPYAASKAAADKLIQFYQEKHGLNTIITRSSNNYGPHQYPEKLIPLIIQHALNNQKIPIYGDGKNIRDWIHVLDNVRGIWLATTRGTSGEVYNFGSNNEWENIKITKAVLKLMNKPESLIEFVEDRKGHDKRYAIDSSKSQKLLGWKPETSFDEGLKSTILWYQENLQQL